MQWQSDDINRMKKIEDLSKFQSRKEWEENIWHEFLRSIEKTRSGKDVAILLNNLLSANEKKLIVKRLSASALISAGKTYKEIGEILWISPSTISALKKSIRKNASYQSSRHYSEMSAEEKRKAMENKPQINAELDYFLNFPWPKKIGKGRWKFLKYQGKHSSRHYHM